ncbi:hypothetical protein N9251_03075 [Gammaproteobacteria bacterium]|nr:hypothetical protein [Gammaproteobacteria bacterium]
MKVCSKCNERKPLSEYYFRVKSEGTLRADCKTCVSTKQKENRNKDLEGARARARENAVKFRDRKAAYDKEYHAANKEKKNRISREHYEANKEAYRQRAKEWRQDNLANRRQRYKDDPSYRLKFLIAARMRSALGSDKSAGTIELLGCDADYFKRHLESQFTTGMHWGQRGLWHLDHIQPLAAFDLTDPVEQRYAFHWSNVQPLWAEDNLRKNDKYDPAELEAYLNSELPEPL